MYPACQAVTRYILPIFRSFVAKELVEKYNFTQIEAAEKLGTTQAAISQYLHSKRGHINIKKLKDLLPLIQNAACDAAKDIATERKGVEEVMANFCNLCTLLRKEGKTIRLNRQSS
ncbi:MAG: helix-turn-helix domain-containing protein [Candidatus Brockarchaeota archaeon]|nr:helix-turn-helix domain-containing protein [Candidatus Brockarchaeota archaeon]